VQRDRESRDAAGGGQVITSVDPGTTESALVKFDGKQVSYSAFLDNEDILQMAREGRIFTDSVAIEDIESFGMPVGKETFGTVRFIGRLQEALERHGIKTRLIGRKSVKVHLCGTTKAKDPNIAIADYALANP
jgi:hypothetical protein